MHEKLSNSPITYVLIQIRFTNIESIEKYVPELQESIRQEFPFFKKITIQAIDLRDSQQPRVSVVNQWHFMDKDSVTGIILDGASVSIHTSKYDDFVKLQNQLERVLVEFNKILKISLYVRLGLRYINLVKSHLDIYVQPELLGFHLQKESQFEKKNFLVKTELTQESKSGVIKVKSAHIGDKKITSIGQNLFVPVDVANTVHYLSFDHHEKPTNEFLLLDIDHFDAKSGKFDVKEIIKNLTKLQDAIYSAFCSAVTPKALEDWK